MVWLGKVSLGGFPDLAGAVTKLSESVKNIEKNFDSALGLEEKQDVDTDGSGVWASTSESIGLFEPVMTFMGQRGDGNASDSSVQAENLKYSSPVEEPKRTLAEGTPASMPERAATLSEEKTAEFSSKTKDVDSPEAYIKLDEPPKPNNDISDENLNHQSEKDLLVAQSVEVENDAPILMQKSDAANEDHAESLILSGNSHLENIAPYVTNELHDSNDLKISQDDNEAEATQHVDDSSVVDNGQISTEIDSAGMISLDTPRNEHTNEMSNDTVQESSTRAQLEPPEILPIVSDASIKQFKTISKAKEPELHSEKLSLITTKDVSVSIDPLSEIERMKQEMKMMEAALQGVARQAQAKADEIAKLMTDNEQLKSEIEDMKRKSSEAEIYSLRDEYHQRLSSLERKGSLESICDSLAEELVKMTEQCEKLQVEAVTLPSLRAELEALRRRHSSALELMGERDEELEELRADIIDLKEMYREHVDLLVNKINMISSASGVVA